MSEELVLEDLFEIQLPGNGELSRCSCGQLFNTYLPNVCKCGAVKLWWRTGNKTLHLTTMKLDHLANAARSLGEKISQLPNEPWAQAKRKEYEVAMDLVYQELGSRDQEIQQQSGILSALKKSVARST